ncbi:MAG: response regulator [Pirellulaceae bacterium]
MKPRLLVTDDDNAFRTVLCEGLERRGFYVSQACDGDEAIEFLSQNEVHLALVDYHMPRVTGLEVMRHVRQIGQSLPCVMMTAQLDDSLQQAAMQLNAYQVLAKPVRLAVLCSVIGTALYDAWGWQADV